MRFLSLQVIIAITHAQIFIIPVTLTKEGGKYKKESLWQATTGMPVSGPCKIEKGRLICLTAL